MIPLEYQIAITQYDAAIADWIANGCVMTELLSSRILYWRSVVGKFHYGKSGSSV